MRGSILMLYSPIRCTTKIPGAMVISLNKQEIQTISSFESILSIVAKLSTVYKLSVGILVVLRLLLDIIQEYHRCTWALPPTTED